MTSKKTPGKNTELPPSVGMSISNCHFEMNSSVSDEVANAVHALASAARENAIAIARAADALQFASKSAITIKQNGETEIG